MALVEKSRFFLIQDHLESMEYIVILSSRKRKMAILWSYTSSVAILSTHKDPSWNALASLAGDCDLIHQVDDNRIRDLQDPTTWHHLAKEGDGAVLAKEILDRYQTVIPGCTVAFEGCVDYESWPMAIALNIGWHTARYVKVPFANIKL